jgi:hypothetical protein
MKRQRERGLPARALFASGAFCGRIESSALKVIHETAGHTLIRIGRNEAACSCGLWHVLAGEGLLSEITRTLNGLHEEHRAASVTAGPGAS